VVTADALPTLIAHQEREGFARLLAEHGPALGRVARVYARSAAEAADLEQEIALAIWRALPAFRGDASLRTFLLRVAHNRGISHRAREASRETLPLDGLDGARDVPDPRAPADDALDLSARRRALFHAMSRLPVGAATLLSLALEGLTHEEIALVVGSTPNSVAVRLSRARATLREMLEVNRER
jgi:RNA polymerase sigma-70 factor (ECF subfamily)